MLLLYFIVVYGILWLPFIRSVKEQMQRIMCWGRCWRHRLDYCIANKTISSWIWDKQNDSKKNINKKLKFHITLYWHLSSFEKRSSLMSVPCSPVPVSFHSIRASEMVRCVHTASYAISSFRRTGIAGWFTFFISRRMFQTQQIRNFLAMNETHFIQMPDVICQFKLKYNVFGF